MQHHHFEQQPLSTFTEQAYLDYAMYVILDRALPSVTDGLKPVQRRIIFAMSELGLKWTSKHKKSARTVGDVLGKYHPHGDTACYEAMVLMAQHFSYRYPLIDGQGNWGSIDEPKSFAAMRYTEARLAPYAQSLLQECGQGTCQWVPNFDGTLKEPALLPARLPNLLLNGASGIAVGMATDIPPHNLNEVVAALIHLLDHPSATTEDLMQHIPGPDFPTGGECITTPEEMLSLYNTGRGTLKLRARHRVIEQDIIIEELPYQVSANKILQQIADQMQSKKLPMITDLRDESDQDHPVRVVLTLRSKRVDTDALMHHLYATTDLEKNQRFNANAINLDRKPCVMPLKTLCEQWLSFRRQTVEKRTRFRLEHIEARTHILQGLLLIYAHIDEVIAIIRSNDDPLKALMDRYSISETQAEAILAIRLKQLAKLEEIALRQEHDALLEEAASLEKLLASPKAMTRLIKQELRDDAKRYGDARRTRFVKAAPSKPMTLQVTQPSEPITIVLSEKGWIRCAKGHDIDPGQLTYKSGDRCLITAQGRSQQALLLFDDMGRSYTLSPSDLPSARGLGDPVTKYLKLQGTLSHIILVNPDDHLLLAQNSGYAFVCPTQALITKNKAGRQSISLKAPARLLTPSDMKPQQTPTEHYVAFATAQGRLLIIDQAELPILEKGKGLKVIAVLEKDLQSSTDALVAMVSLKRGDALKVQAGRRHMTLQPQDWALFQGARAKRGQKLPRGFRQVTALSVNSG